MKFPKRWPNRARKSLVPDKPLNKGPVPKKYYPATGKSSPNDWRRRWFLPIAATILTSSAMVMPAPAQNVPAGPVQMPTTVAASPNTAPSPVPAQQIATPDAGDIHDIRGPISIPYEWLWAAYVAAGFLAIASLYSAWRWIRKQAVARAKLPFEIALERLEAARALMTADSVREYAFTVSEVIRVYIEQRFNEKAARRTTEEFLFDLVQQTDTPLARHRRRLDDFLGHCDLMKFARWQASVPELESMHQSARVFILETRPQPEPAKAGKVEAQANAPVQPELLQAK